MFDIRVLDECGGTRKPREDERADIDAQLRLVSSLADFDYSELDEVEDAIHGS